MAQVTSLTLILPCAVVFYLLVALLRQPLRRLPGPSASIFTSAVLRWHEFQADRTGYIHRLHMRYGPVVRVAPSEVSFSSGPAVKEIYRSGGSGYDKTEFYDLFRVLGRRTMFATLNKANHAERRRLLSQPYANTNILRPESIGGIQERALCLAEKCQTSVGGSLDVYLALHSYAFDCVTHHLFAPHGSRSLLQGDDEEVMREVTFDDSLHNRLLHHHYPSFHLVMNRLLALVAKPRQTQLSIEFARRACNQANMSSFTLLSHVRGRLSSIDVEAESLDHMVAGIDTTGDALCFLMWEISQPRSFRFQRMLQADLRQGDSEKFLDAIIHEGLRCFPAIPMSLPRYVPKGGRLIDGYFIPGGIIVSCQAYSVHRMNPHVFPCPDEFDPERWLDSKGQADRNRLFFAFSSGGRGCIGRHLAVAEMKMALKFIYKNFTTVPDLTMTEDMMTMTHQLISSRPKFQKCLLQFLPIK